MTAKLEVVTYCLRHAEAEPAQQSGIGEASSQPSPATAFHHAIMNLPASAIGFLDAFNGAFSRAGWEHGLPLVHCYCFQRKDESHAGDMLVPLQGSYDTDNCAVPAPAPAAWNTLLHAFYPVVSLLLSLGTCIKLC